MMKQMAALIKRLYTVFEKYPVRTPMPGSPLYDDLGKWNKDLLSKPLHQLSQDDLSRFCGSVMLTWGEAEDFKHFLPRILELVAEIKPPYSISTIFERIKDLEKQSKLEEDEKELLTEYYPVLWDQLLGNGDSMAEFEFQEYFAAIASVHGDFRDLVERWEKHPSPNAAKHLALYVVSEHSNLFQKNKINEWNDDIQQAEILESWLLSDSVIQLLQSRFFELEQAEYAEKISWAEQILSQQK